jgi:glycosyltransferase involved in cell wall biosynthesis
VRILQVLTQSSGGPSDHVRDLARELGELGHEVLVLAPADLTNQTSVTPNVSFEAFLVPSLRASGSAILRLRQLVAQWKPDIVHCQDRRAGLVGRVVGKATATPSVYTLHGAPDELAHLVPNNSRIGHERRRARFMYLSAERILARMSHSRVIVASSALRSYVVDAIELPASTVDVIPNGIRSEDYDPCIPESGFDVVWLGVMSPVKRVDVLLDAMARLPEDVHVRLVGDGPLRSALEARAAALQLGNRVHFAGFEPQPSSSLSAAHVAVLSSDAENCPLALLQAMASGCAVVATSVGGIPEIVRAKREGILVPPGNPGALARALLTLRDNPELRQGLARGAQARAGAYTARDMAERTLETYQRAIRPARQDVTPEPDPGDSQATN